MLTKHRIPSIFNLSMVDVLCCALGCVILLWLINLREAKQRAMAASISEQELSKSQLALGESGRRLAAAEGKVAETSRLLAAARADQKVQMSRAATAERERDESARQVRLAREQVDELEKKWALLQARSRTDAERLAKKSVEAEELAKSLTASRSQLLDALSLLRIREEQAAAGARRVEEAANRLKAAEARLGLMRDALPGLREEAGRYRSQAALLQTRIEGLEREAKSKDRQLSGTDERIGELQREAQTLRGQLAREQSAAENRFAGMQLTGRRVVFLVDMSGSMELVDENTKSPEKWSGVREAVTRIMKSLSMLEKFQVILFAKQVTYLLGSEGEWLDYDPKLSADRVARSLALVRPQGNTDMYTGFEAAFRYRYLGLDTIYLFSDGLPNIGAGLDPEVARSMKETEREVILSRYIRQMLTTVWNHKVGDRVPVRINTVGFFYESPDVGAFLWALARENDGSFAGMSRP
jgi:hypothetical protein